MICSNGHKHNEPDKCPFCGDPVPEDNRVQQWNSTLKINPQKAKIKKTYPKAKKKSKRNMADIMRKFVESKYPNYSGQPVPCSNCGRIIQTLKFENVSHIEPKSLAPDKAEDPENLEILCGPTDYFGEIDKSCHTLWERNNYQEFKKKRQK